MPSSCRDVREQLISCIFKSPCYLDEGNSVHQCIRDKDNREQLPYDCKLLIAAYSECRRSNLDMRKRFTLAPANQRIIEKLSAQRQDEQEKQHDARVKYEELEKKMHLEEQADRTAQGDPK